MRLFQALPKIFHSFGVKLADTRLGQVQDTPNLLKIKVIIVIKRHHQTEAIWHFFKSENQLVSQFSEESVAKWVLGP